MIDPSAPFEARIRPRWRPAEMAHPPALSRDVAPGRVEPRFALLLSPFYPKDAHASFGKHVLTPTLALTSFAATTPPAWRIRRIRRMTSYVCSQPLLKEGVQAFARFMRKQPSGEMLCRFFRLSKRGGQTETIPLLGP